MTFYCYGSNIGFYLREKTYLLLTFYIHNIKSKALSKFFSYNFFLLILGLEMNATH